MKRSIHYKYNLLSKEEYSLNLQKHETIHGVVNKFIAKSKKSAIELVKKNFLTKTLVLLTQTKT